MILCKSILPALTLGAALLAPLAARGAADQVAFRFAPPAGVAYRATSKVTTGLWITTRGKSRVNETEIVARLRHGGNGGAGAEQTFSVLSVTSKLDGSPMENPLAQILPGRDLTFRVGKDGQILDLVNFQEMLDQARKAMPPERFAEISPLVTPEVLLARRRAAANPLVGALAGKTLAVGETSTANGSLALPNGEIFPVRFTMTLKARERTPACDCVRIDFKTEPMLQNGKPADLGATGQGTTLIDPATLLTWALHHQETILTEEPGARSVMKVDLTVDASLAPER
jgi:hypothetical protein